MIEFPKIGFGAYRISIESQDHRKALIYAIQSGCQLIDTSANYTDGDSERLIGDVLKSVDKKPIIVSKVGYIQGQNLKELEILGDIPDVVEINEDLKHSIHPQFIENQIFLSLKRLGLECLDIYLLHNPEYYFYQEGANQEEYYSRIEKAFVYLEELVEKGLIKEYGISSNNLILSADDPKVTSIDEILKLVQKNNLKSFTTIQFPMNLIELGALDKIDHFSLIEKAKLNQIKTMINRPLNAFSAKGLVRLATYDEFINYPTKQNAQDLFNQCLQSIQQKWDQEDNDGEDFREIAVFKQFTEIWDKLPSPDAVDQVYFGHFFPLLAAIWGGSGLSPEESRPFYELYDVSQLLARKNMSERAKIFHQTAIESGLLEDNKKPLSIAAVEKYLELGIDCVLIGMKEKKYVDQFKHLF